MMTISPKVKSVVSKALVAAIVAGSALVAGCASADGDPEQAVAQSAVDNGLPEDTGHSTSALQVRPSQSAVDNGLLEETGQSPNALQAPRSAVTCSGDQNNGGRICCDATHCCINILGVINCSLPPRQATRY